MPVDNSCGCNQLRMKVKVFVTQSWLCDPMDCSPPVSSVHGILQARTLKWFAIPFSRGSSRPRDWTQVSCIAGRFFTIWAIGEALSWEWGSRNQERSWDWTGRFEDYLQRGSYGSQISKQTYSLREWREKREMIRGRILGTEIEKAKKSNQKNRKLQVGLP